MTSAPTVDPAILFDLDGTLVDTAYEHVLAWSAALRSADLVVPNWKIHRRIGMSGSALVRQLVRDPHHKHGKVDIEYLESKHDTAFNKIVSGGVRPLLGARKLLEHLTRIRVSWAIATTGGRKQTERLLAVLGLSPKTIVVTGDEVAKAKPSPDVFVLAAQRLKCQLNVASLSAIASGTCSLRVAGERLRSAFFRVAIARRNWNSQEHSVFTPIQPTFYSISKTWGLVETRVSATFGRDRLLCGS